MNYASACAIRVLAGSCLAVGLAACDPDYTKKGNDGGRILETTRGVNYDAGRIGVTNPQCGQAYFVSSTARQQLFVCNNYDFTPLYDRAQASANYQATLVTCPTECPGPFAWENFRRWECADLFNPVIAFATVEMGVLCPKPGMPRPAGLGSPTAAQLATNGHAEGGQPNSRPSIVEEIGAEAQIACNTREAAQYDYSEPVPGCNKVRNYQPYVQKADDLARKYHGSLSCKPGCSRQPYKSERKQWRCQMTQDLTATAPARYAVQVRIYFEVDCR